MRRWPTAGLAPAGEAESVGDREGEGAVSASPATGDGGGIGVAARMAVPCWPASVAVLLPAIGSEVPGSARGAATVRLTAASPTATRPVASVIGSVRYGARVGRPTSIERQHTIKPAWPAIASSWGADGGPCVRPQRQGDGGAREQRGIREQTDSEQIAVGPSPEQQRPRALEPDREGKDDRARLVGWFDRDDRCFEGRRDQRQRRRDPDPGSTHGGRSSRRSSRLGRQGWIAHRYQPMLRLAADRGSVRKARPVVRLTPPDRVALALSFCRGTTANHVLRRWNGPRRSAFVRERAMEALRGAGAGA